MPSGAAGRWFDAFERARVESLGARRFAGAAANLRRYWRVPDQPSGPERAFERQILDSVREALTGQPVERTLREAGPIRENGATTGALKAQELRQLSRQAADQHRFAQVAIPAIARLLNSASGDAGEAAVGGGSAHGPVRDSDDTASPDSSDERSEDDDQARTESTGSADDAEETQSVPALHDDPVGQAVAMAVTREALENDIQTADEAAWTSADQAVATVIGEPRYRAFTTRFDRIVAASKLAETAELQHLRQRLDTYLEQQGRLVQQLANRLARHLLARQRRAWQCDQPEGVLDTARLTRLVIEPQRALVFQHETDGPFRDTAVTLLIDNSRSMLGRPILVAAAAGDILARTLERCGIAVEVLGYTTGTLDGGASARRWEALGRPASPGRLNDLRHIVYKAADQPWRHARRGFGLMLKPELLNQNIDGEALQWAHGRLVRRPESRRILIMVSDGAPVDVSTLAANHEHYLDSHLRQVIDRIEARTQVELLAIGIGHDVAGWYSRAIRIADARQLGPVLVTELAGLFAPSP